MDVFEIKIKDKSEGDDKWKIAIPYINGISLIDILREIELKYDSKIAGEYDGKEITDFIKDLDCENITNTEKKSLVICTCGFEGCWCLLANIQRNNNFVIWSNFEQNHRPEWKYDDLKEFKFDSFAYSKEFLKIKSIVK